MFCDHDCNQSTGRQLMSLGPRSTRCRLGSGGGGGGSGDGYSSSCYFRRILLLSASGKSIVCWLLAIYLTISIVGLRLTSAETAAVSAAGSDEKHVHVSRHGKHSNPLSSFPVTDMLYAKVFCVFGSPAMIHWP